MSLEAAKARGFHEAIRINERGQVTSACMANVFWLKDEQLFTPAISTGCLPGTTREFVMENLQVNEVEAGIDGLKSADAIFLTSAGLGVVGVDEFDGRAMKRVEHDLLDLVPKHLKP
jgi:branched-subunit amino acid aminotransferase/4-amino-4-deoxychorismate lyase